LNQKTLLFKDIIFRKITNIDLKNERKSHQANKQKEKIRC